MKKIFYILTAAIVALGTMACENEGFDNLNPEIKGEGLYLTAEISRTGLENNMTTWTDGDVVTITFGGKTFYFAHQGGGVFFSDTEGVFSLKGQSGLTAWYNYEGIDSSAGVAGARLSAEGGSFDADGKASGFNFEIQSAFLKFSTSANVKFTGDGLFNKAKETYTGNNQYIAINPKDGVTLSYSVDGITCKTIKMNFEAGKVYNLQTLWAPVASVGTQGYKTLDEAATAAKGATIALWADGDVSQACQIEKKNADCKINVTGNFVALKNYANKNGYYDVVAATKHSEFKIRGDFNSWGWNDAKDLYCITGTDLWVVPEVTFEANKNFKFANESWSDAWGANTTTAIAANKWSYAGSNNITVKTAGTYNVYYESIKGVYNLDNISSQYSAPVFVTYYLKANSSNVNWDQGGAWFAAYFWDNSNTSVNRTEKLENSDTAGIYKSPEFLKGYYTRVIFLRMSKGAANTGNMWTRVDGENDGHWNKTGDVTLPTDSKNLFTPKSWDNATTTWSTK